MFLFVIDTFKYKEYDLLELNYKKIIKNTVHSL